MVRHFPRHWHHSCKNFYYKQCPLGGFAMVVQGINPCSGFLLRNRSQILSTGSITAKKYSEVCLYFYGGKMKSQYRAAVHITI